ncbi:MAG: tyrosine-type recombinase/integrase [Ilumatobacteraceae bacterium]
MPTSFEAQIGDVRSAATRGGVAEALDGVVGDDNGDSDLDLLVVIERFDSSTAIAMKALAAASSASMPSRRLMTCEPWPQKHSADTANDRPSNSCLQRSGLTNGWCSRQRWVPCSSRRTLPGRYEGSPKRPISAGWSPNELRHSAASLLSAAGVLLEHIADVLGHTNTRMLGQTYRHSIQPSIVAAVAPMDALFGT